MSSDAALLRSPITADLVHGALELEQTSNGLRPHRLPSWARAQIDDPQLSLAEGQPAGVRVAFHTAATVVELLARPTRRSYAGYPPRPEGLYDLLVDGALVAQRSASGGDTLAIDVAAGTSEVLLGPIGSVRFDGLSPRVKLVELWLPHDESTELVALLTDAAVTPFSPPAGRRWLHHGSSISQGSNAAHPTGTWPVVAATAAGLDLLNLGLGGSAVLDPSTARVLRDTPADLISLKLGINVVNTDLMRLRAFVPAVHGFLDTVREGHPQTPLLVISPILCPIHEHTPGPTGFDPTALAAGQIRFVAEGDDAEVPRGRLNLHTIRGALAAIVSKRSAGDRHLHYLDGRELYGARDEQQHPLLDNLHPDGPAHALMGHRFAQLALSGAGHLAAVTGRR